MKKIMTFAAVLALLAAAYLLFWPVPVQPVAWQPKASPGYSGPFATNQRLAGLMQVALLDGPGPEHIAIGPDGWVYTATEGGIVLRMKRDGSSQQVLARTGGRVLGFDFDEHGQLIAADAYKGLLSIGPDGRVRMLANQVAPDDPIRYADAVAVSPDGLIYFTEGSHRFAPKEWGGPLQASMAEILEQGGSGRVLVFDPSTGRVRVVARGLVFANGIVVSHDRRAVLVAESGRYRVWRIETSAREVDLRSAEATQAKVVLDNLPGFPDNLTRGAHGRYWVGLPKARSGLADALADWPFLRAAAFRVPKQLLPVPQPHGHALAFTDDGQIVVDLQDPSGSYPDVTGVTEDAGHFYIHSLHSNTLGILVRPADLVIDGCPEIGPDCSR